MGLPPAGHTLVELLAGLFLAAILTALSAPTFLELRSASQSRESLRRLQTLLQLARHEAVARQSRVTVCIVDTTRQCLKDSRGALHVMAFLDSNNNRQWDAAETQVYLQHLGIGALRWRASLGRHYLVFTPSGRTRENGSLYFCPTSHNERQAWTLVINRVGRVYTTVDRNNDGVREDSQGRNLSCAP